MSGHTTPERASFAAIVAQVAEAAARLADWHAQQPWGPDGTTYVAAGHDAIAALDAALREAYVQRGHLVGELRRDEDERMARTEVLLAEIRRERVARAAGTPDMSERQNVAPALTSGSDSSDASDTAVEPEANDTADVDEYHVTDDGREVPW